LRTDCRPAPFCVPTQSTAVNTLKIAADEITIVRSIFPLSWVKWRHGNLLTFCSAESGVILREDHVTHRVGNVALRAARDHIRWRSLFKGILVSETKITPPLGLCRESLRVLHRYLQTGELAFKISVSAWSTFGSDAYEFFHHHRPFGIRPGLLPLPPSKRININVMKLWKGGLAIIEIIWSDWRADKNPLPIYISAKWN